MVATGQEIVREKKNSSRSGKSEILRVLIYLLPSQWCLMDDPMAVFMAQDLAYIV